MNEKQDVLPITAYYYLKHNKPLKHTKEWYKGPVSLWYSLLTCQSFLSSKKPFLKHLLILTSWEQ